MGCATEWKCLDCGHEYWDGDILIGYRSCHECRSRNVRQREAKPFVAKEPKPRASGLIVPSSLDE
jgi:DNA-directed RNA polymerase subunit RPC12/RpoP